MRETSEIKVTHLEDGDYIVSVDGKALTKGDLKTCMQVLTDYLKDGEDDDRD